ARVRAVVGSVRPAPLVGAPLHPAELVSQRRVVRGGAVLAGAQGVDLAAAGRDLPPDCLAGQNHARSVAEPRRWYTTARWSPCDTNTSSSRPTPGSGPSP